MFTNSRRVVSQIAGTTLAAALAVSMYVPTTNVTARAALSATSSSVKGAVVQAGQTPRVINVKLDSVDGMHHFPG